MSGGDAIAGGLLMCLVALGVFSAWVMWHLLILLLRIIVQAVRGN